MLGGIARSHPSFPSLWHFAAEDLYPCGILGTSMFTNLSRSLRNQLITANGAWFLCVMLLAWYFGSPKVFALCVFPPLALSWAIKNEGRLQASPLALPRASSTTRFHFFITAPLAVGAELIITLVRARREDASLGDYFSLSFGTAVTILFAYVLYIYARKRQKSAEANNAGGDWR